MKNMKVSKVFPLNLQFFADGGEDGSNNDGGETDDKTKAGKGDVENKENVIDEESVRKKSIQEYMKTLGVDTEEELSSIVKKHHEDEAKNLSELEKVRKDYAKAVRDLTEVKEKNMLLEAQVEAIKLGAKSSLVEDLVLIAKARVTNEKTVKDVLSEMKEGETGSTYFESASSDDNDDNGIKGRTVTRVNSSKKKEDKKNDKSGSLAKRLLEGRETEKKKSSYWS